MALTFTALKARALPYPNYSVYSILLDNSYPAAGYALTASNFGLDKAIDAIVFGPAVASSNFLIAAFDPTTYKLRVFYPTGGATAAPGTVAQPVAAANTIAASTATPAAGATGMTSTAAQPAIPVTLGTITAGALTPGAGKEVLTGADLSAFTIIAVAFGS